LRFPPHGNSPEFKAVPRVAYFSVHASVAEKLATGFDRDADAALYDVLYAVNSNRFRCASCDVPLKTPRVRPWLCVKIKTAIFPGQAVKVTVGRQQLQIVVFLHAHAVTTSYFQPCATARKGFKEFLQMF